jgi:signal transduction histidine kinase
MEVIHLNRTAVAGALSASVAHELNQPLGAIQSHAEAALLYLHADPPNIARVQDILGDILRDDQRAARIITHLRGLLKKRTQSEMQEFDFNDIVDDTLQIIRPEAVKKGIELSVMNASSPLPVRGDRIQVQQVLMNLAMNGIDAMRDCSPGDGKMSISTALVGSSAIRVSVADSGTGIPPDKLNKVFDAFYTTKGHGTGLGLSIARTIVETYGGKIWAENRPGGGATFFFTMPLSKAMVWRRELPCENDCV